MINRVRCDYCILSNWLHNSVLVRALALSHIDLENPREFYAMPPMTKSKKVITFADPVSNDFSLLSLQPNTGPFMGSAIHLKVQMVEVTYR